MRDDKIIKCMDILLKSFNLSSEEDGHCGNVHNTP